MPERRPLSVAVVLGSLLCGPLAAGDVFDFLSPALGDIVVGPTRFEFEIHDGRSEIDRIDVYVEGVFAGSALPPDWAFSWSASSDGEIAAEIAAVAYSGGTKVAIEKIVTSELSFGEVVDVAAVQLYPVVRKRNGGYVSGLTKEDFVVFDQGKEVEIEFFSDDPAVLTVAMLLDVSESMRNDIGFVQEAACAFIQELRLGDVVSVYAFNNALVPVARSSQDHLAVMNSIRQLTPGGGTALFDAVVRVLDDLSKVSSRKVLIVFSDGEDRSSLATLARAVAEARRSDVLIYTIGVTDVGTDMERRQDLVDLGGATGGEAYIVSRLKNLGGVFRAILEDLRAQYILSYSPPPGDEGERSVRVGLREKRSQVRCRQSYYYASSD